MVCFCFVCLVVYIILFVSLFYSILFVSLKLEKYVFKMFAFFVLKYHVSYNKRVLNERKSEQVHKPYASIFLDNAIHIAW